MNPELRCTRILGEPTKTQKIGAIWSSLREKHCRSIKHDPTQSLFSTQYLRYVLRKWVSWRLERIFIRQSTSIPKVTASCTHAKFATWTQGSFQPRSENIRRPSKQTKREVRGDSSHASRRNSQRSTRRLEAVTLITAYKVYLTQQSRKKTLITKETVTRLNQQLETHPNRDSLIEGLNKTEEFNLFSEKSKELITSVCNTAYFELYEISSEIQCPDCSLYWEVGIVYCTCGKCMLPSERNRQLNKARYDVLSIPDYVIEKNPTHGGRHGPTMRQHMHNKAHEMLNKAQKHKYQTLLGKWYDDDKIPQVFVYNLLELSKNAEGVQGPLNQRSVFKDAKQTSKRLYHDYTVITGPPEHQVPPMRDQQFEGHDENEFWLDASTRWRYCPSSTTHSSSSSSSRWQPGSDLWSTWNWDSWKSSSWNEKCIFLKKNSRMSDFSLAGNLITWKSTGGVNSTPSAHTFPSCALCQRACPSLLSQLSR